MSQRYSATRIRRGLIHFLVGKLISAGMGFVTMLLVVRYLTIEAFATYSVLIALVEIVSALSGLGIEHLMQRYVPELYEKGWQQALQKLFYSAFRVRIGMLAITCFLLAVNVNLVSTVIGLQHQQPVFLWFLLLILIRITGFFLSQTLESTLHQTQVQIAFSTATLIRCLGMLTLTFFSQASATPLLDVIKLELFSEWILLMLLGLSVRSMFHEKAILTHPHPNGDEERAWLQKYQQPLIQFARSAYCQHLLITPYGGQTNRLLGGVLLTAIQMASFGFAQSLYEYVKRYLPAQLLNGLIRPVLVARFTKERDFKRLYQFTSDVFLINLILMLGLVLATLIAGEAAFLKLTSGKYGVEAQLILLGLWVVLIFESYRQQLELLAQVVERYEILIPSNAILALSVLIAMPFVHSCGAVAFPLANSLGLLLANIMVRHQLESLGFDMTTSHMAHFKILSSAFLAWLFAIALHAFGHDWQMNVFGGIAIYALLIGLFFRSLFRAMVSQLTGGGRDSALSTASSAGERVS